MNDTGTTPISFAAVLMAGGQSRRMGQDKAWLDWHGEPLWHFQLRKLAELNPALLLISSRQEQGLVTAQAESVFDPPENQGPLPALARCLARAQMPLLVLAVDMPQMTAALLRELLSQDPTLETGAVCRGDHGYEPLCALYPPAVLPLLQEAVSRGDLRLQSFVQRAVENGLLRAIPLSKEREALFFNLNTPADLA